VRLSHTSVIDHEVDILIVGAGLVGFALMRALMHTNFKCLLLDNNAPNFDAPNFDSRSLALSHASYKILKMLGVWSEIKNHAAEIATIHVSQQKCFGRTQLNSADHAFGYVVEMPYLYNALSTTIFNAKLVAIDQSNNIVTVQQDERQQRIRAKIIVGADGANSYLRNLCGLTAQIKNFSTDVIVANIELARSHKNFAYERFTPKGPLALLPLTNNRMAQHRMSLVWSNTPSEAQKLCAISTQDFIHKLQKEFGYRAGKIVNVGQRSIHKLHQVVMPKLIANSVVFIGNAANTLHPVAGQGFNLGLRDAVMLAQCMLDYGLTQEMLQKYQALRESDHKAITKFTASLTSNLIPNMLRGLGLLALDNCAWIKQQIIKTASGFGGVTPDLACEIQLRNNHES
jgi:2-octaprenyl-6-methoxyphenol hydroxylase